MGELEIRLQERSRQLAVNRAEAEVRARERRQQEKVKEAERQQRIERAKVLGMEMVGLLDKHNVPVVPLWQGQWVAPSSIPERLRLGQEDNAQIHTYPLSRPGWRIVSHYVHLSDYSGGVTTNYALGTNGIPYTYRHDSSRRYPSLPASTDNPSIEGAVDISEITDCNCPTDNSREVLKVLNSVYFQDGLISLIEKGEPADTMYDQAYPFRNK